MRLSQILVTTLREDPADAEIPSHKLLARGGYIQKVSSGLYTYGPLMWRTLRKIMQIVREELDREGAQEVMMPILHPKELWVSSGRWERYVTDGIMFTLKDQKGAEYCLGPTHEEVITAYANQNISSYKQLPVNLYQIQDKFRDEIRPRYGLMRGREFIMMDAYSFDADQGGLDESYAKMARAYRRVFARCGLDFRAVQADSGAIGGSGSEEFMVVADAGEDTILYCAESGYAANVEKADSIPAAAPDGGAPRPLEKHPTPDVRTVEQLEAFFRLPAAAMAKTLLYRAVWSDREEIVAVMMRGDLDVNEVKLVNALDALAVKLASDEDVTKATGAAVGFAGPIGLPDKLRLLADKTLERRSNLLTGCNQTGYHCLNVNLGRDCRMPEFRELRLAKAGERSPDDKGPLLQARGIEVGHIFKLGTKYSSAMGATFMAEDGKPKPFVMGCYGIGVSRTAQSAVEQHHDEKGICWPASIAPFQCAVVVVDNKRMEQLELGTKLWTELRASGVDACLDDRALRAGPKFTDLELLGFPYTIVAGRRAAEGVVEFGVRSDGTKTELPAAEAVAKLRAALAACAGSPAES
ncbi:MAG: proline--tRNA ligase [Planctomycetes bacterium]|nr:proline--tRNA ligase [Planctomycetota bacterium]